MQDRPGNRQQWTWDAEDQPPQPQQPYAPTRQQYTIPPQHTPYQPPRPPKKKHRARNILGGAFALLVGIIVLATALSGTNTAAPNTSSAAAAATPSGNHQADAPATVVLTQSGNGQDTTKTFTVAADWSLTYSFNCAGYGQAGNFIVYVDYPNGDIIANSLAASGGTTTYQSDDGGVHSLTVSTECAWTIKVTSGN